MKLIWVADIHLNFINPDQLRIFCSQITSLRVDSVLIGGAAGDAPNLAHLPLSLKQNIQDLLYFVLGNQGYVFSSTTEAGNQIQKITKNSSDLHYLPDTAAIKLPSNPCL